MNPLRRIFALLAVLLVSAVGCSASDDPQEEGESSPDDVGSESEGLSTVNCTTSKATGYRSGTPFAITVVHVDGKPVEEHTADAYYVMAQAAARDGVNLHIVSGFRTMAEQERLYSCYKHCNCNSCNLAARPGYSNHQSGHALDLNTSARGVYSWLGAHASRYGFARTVPSERWHWEWWGGGPGGGACGGRPPACVPTKEICNGKDDDCDGQVDEGGVCNQPPRGNLDEVSCQALRGWAQDTNVPDKPIGVHVYFDGPAGSARAKGVPLKADVARSDLCSAIGSCVHGFSALSPLSLHDGAAHEVHAYAIDSAGGPNSELRSSPKTLKCAPSLPAGVRRPVGSTAPSAWRFDPFWQKLPAAASAVDALERGAPFPDKPVMIQANGAREVWILDGTLRRHVPSPDAAAAWGLDLSTVRSVTPQALAAYREGLPFRPRPVLVVGSDKTTYVLDDKAIADAKPAADAGVSDASGGPPDEPGRAGDGGAATNVPGEAPTGGPKGDAAPGGSASSSAGSDVAAQASTEPDAPDSGCSAARSGRTSPVGWGALFALGALFVRARRRGSARR